MKRGEKNLGREERGKEGTEIALSLRGDFELWSFKQQWISHRLQGLWSWTECIFALQYDYKPTWQGTESESLNRNAPYRLIGSGTIRRSGLVEGSLQLDLSFEVSEAQANPTFSLFLLTEDLNIELVSAIFPLTWLYATMLSIMTID